VLFLFCCFCIYLYVLYLYDLFHILLLPLQTYGPTDPWVCVCVCVCVMLNVILIWPRRQERESWNILCSFIITAGSFQNYIVLIFIISQCVVILVGLGS
jgi:hypothetical protein